MVQRETLYFFLFSNLARYLCFWLCYHLLTGLDISHMWLAQNKSSTGTDGAPYHPQALIFFHRKNLYNRSRPEVLCWRGKGPMVKDNKDFSELNSGTMELWMSLGRELWSCAESLKCCWGMLEAMIWTYGPCTHRKHVLMSSPSI